MRIFSKAVLQIHLNTNTFKTVRLQFQIFLKAGEFVDVVVLFFFLVFFVIFSTQLYPFS